MEIKIESTGDKFKMRCKGSVYECLDGLVYGTATIYLNGVDRAHVSFDQFMDMFSRQVADCKKTIEGAGGNGDNKT